MAARVPLASGAAQGRQEAEVLEADALTKADALMKGAAFAVADGISSSQISQIAAETAVKTLVGDYYDTPQAWTAKTSGARVIEATNSWLFAQNRARRTSDMNHGMVCTLSALILRGREAHLFHVGDSRISRLHSDSLEPLTQDHTTVLSEHEQYLGRALGMAHRVDIDYLSVPLKQHDIFLLTTDGVHEFIGAGIVNECLQLAEDLDSAARLIAEKALEQGSEDNLTVQIVRIDDLPTDNHFPRITDAALPILQPLRPGQKIDGFTVVREIHHSSRSQLTLATDAAGNRCALKVPGTETRENPAYLQRFLFEEWVARRVHSPHLIKAADAGGARSASYVATQWISGSTLRQWMHDHPEPNLERVRDIAEQVVKGLRALHRQEMIHQDLRPENIMLDEQGTVVIIDLGSVAIAGVEQASSGQMGAMPGTLQYTAPEYLSGDSVSWRSDLFSLGVIVYEMLTGSLPYGAQVARVRNRRDQQRLTYKAADNSAHSIPLWVDHALAKACHRDPHRRYDALSEFVADLRTPSADYSPHASRPLLERNPLRFWQGVVALQFVLILWLLAHLIE